MVGHDPARFDYLFEPIDGETESAGGGDIEVLVDVPVTADPKRSWPWFAVVAATVLGVGVALIAPWSTPVDAVQVPSAVTTTAPPRPVATTTPVVVSVPEGVPTVDSEPSLEPAPPQEPTAPSTLEPPPAPVVRATPAVRPPSPTVRSPMSVSPAPRPAFPNQQVPDGDGNRGGLLGRGGLL